MLITYRIIKNQATNFRIKYNLSGFRKNDTVSLYYSTFNWDTNLWDPDIKIREPYSLKLSAGDARVVDNLPILGGGKYRFRFVVSRKNVAIYSLRSEPINSSDNVNVPTGVSLNTTNNTISWSFSKNIEDLPLSHFILQCVYYEGDTIDRNRIIFRINRTVSKNLRQYQFNNLSAGNVVFNIYAVDADNRRSKFVQVNSVPQRITSDQPYIGDQLFDIESFATDAVESSLGEYATKFIEAMIVAANRWNNFIKFKQSDYNLISLALEQQGRTWKGIWLRNLSEETRPEAAASCGPFDKIDFVGPNDQLLYTLPMNFFLNINKSFLQYSTNEELSKVLAHELGHALGIGIFWRFNNTLNTDPTSIFPYSVNSKNKIDYPQAQKAYNNYFNINRHHIPVNNEGLGMSAHWAHITNTSTPFRARHPAPDYDIMSYGNQQKISLLSIKYLTDIGYEERNPNTSEFDILSNEINMFNVLSEQFSCGTNNELDNPSITTLRISDKYIDIYDENIDLNQYIDDFTSPTSPPS